MSKKWKKAVGVTWQSVCSLALRQMDAVFVYIAYFITRAK